MPCGQAPVALVLANGDLAAAEGDEVARATAFRYRRQTRILYLPF